MLPAGVYNVRYEQDMAIVRTKTQWALLIGLFIFLIFLPYLIGGRWLTFLILTGISIIGLHGLNIITGYTGQISLGHTAFMAVGAFASGTFVVKLGLPFFISLPLAGVVTTLVAMIFGAPSLRVKGYYLMMATLAAYFVITYTIHRIDYISGALGLLVPYP